MRVSKFIKPHKDILLEYIYNDDNNISEPYKILTNLKTNNSSFISGSSSTTNNTVDNTLFQIDPITNNWGSINNTNYPFLQLKDYASGFPISYDTLKIHLPINYTFGEYIGCQVKIYCYNYDNKIIYDLSNFYFDVTDVNKTDILNYTVPPFLFGEKLWGKHITLEFPSPNKVANQRINNSTKTNTINFDLTDGRGLSLNSPVFIEFSFIASKKTINNITTYYLANKTKLSVPQTPEYENLGVRVEHSKNGDFFEIYGIFNNSIGEFNDFIERSVSLGNRYYVEYGITLYEQNIRGKTIKILVDDNFNEKIEYRPVIKYSTTTAIIDVEMILIDAVDNSTIIRRASYGMLQDEVAKYSINLTKINLANASKPKIYNIKSPEGVGIFSGNSQLGVTKPQIYLDPIKVNFTVLADKYRVIAKSDSVLVGKTQFWGMNKLQLVLQPFDNVIQFIIAQDIVTDEYVLNNINNKNDNYNAISPEYMDMTNMGDIKMVIKNPSLYFETGLYMNSNSINLSIGMIVFRIPSSRINDIKKIYDSGVNTFYITSTIESGTTVVYSGVFKIADTMQIVDTPKIDTPIIIKTTDNTAIVTRSNVPLTQEAPTVGSISKGSISKDTTSGLGTTLIDLQNSTPTTNTSTTINGTKTYTSSNGTFLQINFDNTISITRRQTQYINGQGFVTDNVTIKWTNSEISRALKLNILPTNMLFANDSIYQQIDLNNNQYLGTINDLISNLY